LAACSLINHQPAVLFSQNKPITRNQSVVLFYQTKPAPAISHQPTEHTVVLVLCRPVVLCVTLKATAVPPKETVVLIDAERACLPSTLIKVERRPYREQTSSTTSCQLLFALLNLRFFWGVAK
jgi:hypothetical protein